MSKNPSLHLQLRVLMDSQVKIQSITYPYGCIYFRHCAQPEGSTEEQKSSLFQIQKIRQHIEFV